MNVIFKDDRVIDGQGNDLLVYESVNNVEMYKFITILIKNENDIKLKIESKVPIAIKLYEIINQEFQDKVNVENLGL